MPNFQGTEFSEENIELFLLQSESMYNFANEIGDICYKAWTAQIS